MRRIFALFALGCWGFLLAQPPAGIAIRNARIVTGNGPVIAKGTVVLKNGLIDSVGESATIPAGTWVIEGEGLTVYPGLIDSISTLGIGDAAATQPIANAGRGAGAAPQAASTAPARGPEDRPLTSSWLRAADLLTTTDRRLEAARNSGFTSAISWPKRGIFAGQGSVINLAGEKAADMVILPSAGQYMTLVNNGFGGGYPGSSMGTIAYIRQLFMDADRYARIKKQYAENPRGMARPEYDRALEGLMDSPRILLPATRATEISRIIKFSKELGKPTVLYGLQEGYRATDLIKASGLPALVSLRWPEKPRDGDPEDVDALRSLEFRDKAPTTPAEFAKKGIKFAFYADTIESPADIIRAIRKAMQNGLSEADALKAMTINAAEIFGVADRLGSIEKGKIANLVITKGNIFDERQQVQHVIIDGVKYDPAPDAQQQQQPGRPGGNRPGEVRN